jgi:hypothetical protein
MILIIAGDRAQIDLIGAALLIKHPCGKCAHSEPDGCVERAQPGHA